MSVFPDFMVPTDGEIAFEKSLRSRDRLEMRISGEISERMRAAAKRAGGVLPADHPLRLQFVPSAAEFAAHPAERPDPLGEQEHSPLPRLVHRYPDRALLLVTDRCAVHCRHCFRSRFTGGDQGPLTARELDEICAYVGRHPEIRELILSGGDAMMASDAALAGIMQQVRRISSRLVFRVATRVPIVEPSRVGPGLIGLLAANSPVWIVIQANHSEELGRAARSAISSLVDAGLPVLSQTVLLAGINDDVAVLEALMTELVGLRVKPYYLFQSDLAPGIGHLRVDLERALSIVNELRGTASGLMMPVFAVDIPGGAGKVPLEPSALVGRNENSYLLRARDGTVHEYPRG
jgi:lysine 2,3-aminomutase